jgi:hypothetical protein
VVRQRDRSDRGGKRRALFVTTRERVQHPDIPTMRAFLPFGLLANLKKSLFFHCDSADFCDGATTLAQTGHYRLEREGTLKLIRSWLHPNNDMSLSGPEN